MSPRTPLLRPDRYFDDREPTIVRISVVFLVLLAAGPIAVYGVGWVLTEHVDGTVMVDNPTRPPDWVCEDTPTEDSAFDRGCDEPKEIERNVDSILWDAMDRFLGPAFIAFPLAVGLVTLLLHGGVSLAGRSRGLFRTFAVAAWGIVPSLLFIPVMLVAFSLVLDPVTVSPGDDPSVVLQPLIANLESVGPYGSAGGVVSAVWGGVIWRFGLEDQHELDGMDATIVAGLVALLTALFGLM
jgi:hypothetical protein